MDTRTALDRETQRFELRPDAFERLLGRRERKRRNQRIASAVMALVIAIAAIGSLIKMFASGAHQPATQPITPSNVSDLRLLGTEPAEGEFAVSDGLVFVAHGETHQFEAYPMSCYGVRSSCEPKWVTSLDNAHMVEARGGSVYVLSDNDVMYAFSASCGTAGETCRPMWVGTIPGRPAIWGRPELGRDMMYVPGSHRLYAFPTSCTGQCHPAWVSARLPTTADNWKSTAILGDTIFVTVAGLRSIPFPAHCATDGSVCPPSGKRVAGTGGAPLTADGKVFVVESGTLKAIPTRCDAPPCQPLWEAIDLPTGGQGGGMIAANGLIFIADDTAPKNGPPRGGIYAFPTACGSGDAECKPVWTWGTAEHVAIGGIIVTHGHLFASTNSGLSVFGIEPSAGVPLGNDGSGDNKMGTLGFYVGMSALAVLLLALVVLTRRRRINGNSP